MKDTYFSDDVALDWTPPVARKAVGLGHGIRPRGDLTKPEGKAEPAQARITPRTKPPAAATPKVTRRAEPLTLTQALRETPADPVVPTRPKQVRRAESPAPVRPQREITAKAKTPAADQQAPRVSPRPAALPESPKLQIPRWNDLPYAAPAATRNVAMAGPVRDAAEDIASNRAFDLLRTKLRQVAKENGWTNIGITAPTAGCGTTFMATNLALSLSRVGASRSVLMDMNLRRPGVAAALDLQAPGDLRSFLEGRVGLLDQVARKNETLAVVLNDRKEDNAAEILQDRHTRHTLEQMCSALRPDMVIYDLPPMLTFDDVSAFMPQLDALLIISDGTRTTAQQLTECERLLDGHVPLLGVALNNARRAGRVA